MKALKDICRLCGKDSNRFYPKEKLRSVIQRSPSVDVRADANDVFPPSVCVVCKRKLSRWNSKKNENMAETVNITVPDFQPHGTGCSLCSKDEKDAQLLLQRV